MFGKVKKSFVNFIKSEEGAEGSQTAVLVALGTVVAIGLLTFLGVKIKGAVDGGGTTIDSASAWKYGDASRTE